MQIPLNRFPALLLMAALAGCLPQLPKDLASPSPEMRPERFFAGDTEGRGQLTMHGRASRPFKVTSRGSNEPDGSFRLDQTVAYEDGEIVRRTWRMRALDARTYTGTVSDASGEMHGTIEGNAFRLRYLIRQPTIYMEQWLYLQGDGRTVMNRAEVTILGIPWARLEERIVRLEGDSVEHSREAR